MNVLEVSHKGREMFRDLHPSDPLRLIIASYESATGFMANDVPSMPEILSAMFDVYYDLLGEFPDVAKMTSMEVEVILRQNGFDFINQSKMRENSSQHYIGGEIIGL